MCVVLPLFALNIYSLLKDNDPPKFPLPLKYPTIDCTKISANIVHNRNSRIQYEIKTKPFVHFPQNAALNFLHVVASTGNIFSDYDYLHFWDQMSDLENFSFAILHPIKGPTNVNLMCQGKLLRSDAINIDSIDVYPIGFSRIEDDEYSVSRFLDVCFNENKMEILSTTKSIYQNIKLSQDVSSKIERVPYNLDYFTNYLNIEKVENPTIVISAMPALNHKIITDVILPLWAHVFFDMKEKTRKVMFINNQTDLISAVQPILTSEPIIGNISKCFSDVKFALASGSLPYTYKTPQYTEGATVSQHVEKILNFRPEVARDLSNRYIQYFRREINSQKPIIAVDSNNRRFLPQLRRLFPNVTFDLVSDTDAFEFAAATLTNAIAFISSGPHTFAYAVLLPRDATLIEIMPTGGNCLDLGMRWASIYGIKYSRIKSQSECKFNLQNSADFFEQFLAGTLVFQPPSDEDFLSAIEPLLNF